MKYIKMEYTKQQLLGVKFKQNTTEYVILDDGTENGLKFEKPTDIGHYFTGYNTKRVNQMIKDSSITLIDTPSSEPTYEIY